MGNEIPDAKEMFDTAEAFALGSKLMIYEKNKREAVGDYSLSYHGIAPIVSNHAFAIELYFKCIAILEKGQFQRGHHLLELYKYLDHNTQQKIETVFNDFVSTNATLKRWQSEGRRLPDMSLTAVLQQANKAFEQHRYMPEGNHQSYSAGDLTKTLQKYILEFKPEWIDDLQS